MGILVPPLHTHTFKQYKHEFEDFCAKHELDEETYIDYFINGLNREIKMGVMIFNPNTLKAAYALATLENDRLVPLENNKPSFYEEIGTLKQDIEDISERVKNFSDAWNTFGEFLHKDDVDPVPLIVEEHVLECEALPFTCISADDVDPVSSIIVEHVLECEDIPPTYISMDMLEQYDSMEYSYQDFRAQWQCSGFFIDSSGAFFLFPTSRQQQHHYLGGIVTHIWASIYLWRFVGYYGQVGFVGSLISLLFMDELHFVLLASFEDKACQRGRQC